MCVCVFMKSLLHLCLCVYKRPTVMSVNYIAYLQRLASNESLVLCDVII